jgi:hypothetical protein
MAVDLRVVGVFAIGGVPPDANGNQREDYDHNGNHDSAARPRLRVLDFLVGISLGWYWIVIRHSYFPPR